MIQLPAFEVHYNDGNVITTSMAKHVTLEIAASWAKGLVRVVEDEFTGKETITKTVKIRQIAPEISEFVTL